MFVSNIGFGEVAAPQENYFFIAAETILLGKEVFDSIEHLLIRFGYQNLLLLRVYSCVYMLFLFQLSVI